MAAAGFKMIILAVSAVSAAVASPADLPYEQKKYMTNLWQIFGEKFNDNYPDRQGGQYAVMTFDMAGMNMSLDPCTSSNPFSEAHPTNVVAKTDDYANNGQNRPAEIIIIEDYFELMLERFGNNRSPASVSLFINVYTCEESCSAIVAELARKYPSTNFYVGYKHMHAADVLSILNVLSGISNLYFGDVSSMSVYYTQDTGSHICNFISDTVPGVLYSAEDDFKMGDTPEDIDDKWYDWATLIGQNGWSYAKFLFFHPNGELYAVFHGNLNKDVPPTNGDHPWLSHSTTVGDYGWSRYSFLFFDHVGVLYAASSSGFYKGLPPTGISDNWHHRAVTIGSTGWDSFQFLFMHPTDFMMYAVKDGAFYRGSPPSEEISADDWIDQALQIAFNSWDIYKFLFFHPSGLLYAAGNDGSLRVASPPQHSSDNWYDRSTLVGGSGWNGFQFLFFHPSDWGDKCD